MKKKSQDYKNVVSHIGWCISELARAQGMTVAEMQADIFRYIHVMSNQIQHEQFKARLAKLKAQGKSLGDFEKMLTVQEAPSHEQNV